MKKRPKYIEEFVREVNSRLRYYKVKDEYKDTLFIFACDYLMNKGMYQGYNFYVDKAMPNGQTFPALAGSYKKEEFDYLQLY